MACLADVAGLRRQPSGHAAPRFAAWSRAHRDLGNCWARPARVGKRGRHRGGRQRGEVWSRCVRGVLAAPATFRVASAIVAMAIGLIGPAARAPLGRRSGVVRAPLGQGPGRSRAAGASNVACGPPGRGREHKPLQDRHRCMARGELEQHGNNSRKRLATALVACFVFEHLANVEIFRIIEKGVNLTCLANCLFLL